jgi:hypothetical protein
MQKVWNRIAPRVSDNDVEFLGTTFKTKNAGCEYVLQLFHVLHSYQIACTKGIFTAQELSSMILAMKEVKPIPGIPGGMLATMLEKKDTRLANRVASMDMGKRASLEIWCAGYWFSGYKLKSYIKELV